MQTDYYLKIRKTIIFFSMIFSLVIGLSIQPLYATAAKNIQESEQKMTYRNMFRIENGKIYYYNKNGNKVKHKWKTIRGKDYYFYRDGHAAVGFATISGKKYCFNSKGIMHTGWYRNKNKTYYFHPKTGVMVTGKKKINGQRYYFRSNGVMVTNEWVKNKYYGENGMYDASKKEPMPELHKKLKKSIQGYYGTWSIYVKNLDTNEAICINNKKMYAASLIKLYGMAAAYDRMEQGKIKESSLIQNTLRLMIAESDNYSFNDIVRRIGKTYINQWCKENGYMDTRQYHGLSPSGNNQGLRTRNSSNVTTVKDCGLLLESIYRKNCVSPKASRKMLAHLKAQNRRWKIPAGVPYGVTVANKTGETNDTTHDAAIVYSKGADYIICVMATCPRRGWYCASNITKISRMVYNYFN